MGIFADFSVLFLQNGVSFLYRNVSHNIHPSLHCASTTRATEHARGIPACIFEHAQKTDAPEFATMAEVMFSYFVVEHNRPAAIAGPFSSLASYMCPDSTIITISRQ